MNKSYSACFPVLCLFHVTQYPLGPSIRSQMAWFPPLKAGFSLLYVCAHLLMDTVASVPLVLVNNAAVDMGV